jgi:hypothetical protein
LRYEVFVQCGSLVNWFGEYSHTTDGKRVLRRLFSAVKNESNIHALGIKGLK